MRKQVDMGIYWDSNLVNMCTITISNIGLNRENMDKCVKIVQRFTKGDEFFFGFYRTNGMNLTNKEFVKYGEVIPEHFQTYGTYEQLIVTVEKKGKLKTYSGYLTVGSLPVNDGTFELIPWIFHYYLETTVFCPKIDWETFVQSYHDYMKHGASGYIMNGYADLLFTYFDSGEFSIIFNPKLYDKDVIYNEIKRIVSE